MQRADGQGAYLRIGELSRRVGVSSELLRAWERRYGLLSPTRTPGGFRLYGDEDERRVVRMLAPSRDGSRRRPRLRGSRSPRSTSRRTPAAARCVARRPARGRAAPAARPLRRSSRRRRRSTGCCPRSRWRPSCVTPCSRILGELGERWAPRRGVGRAGALRERVPARPAARPRPRLGRRARPARGPRVGSGRPARSRADLLRARPSRLRLANHVSRRRHAARHARRRGAAAAARDRRGHVHDRRQPRGVEGGPGGARGGSAACDRRPRGDRGAGRLDRRPAFRGRPASRPPRRWPAATAAGPRPFEGQVGELDECRVQSPGESETARRFGGPAPSPLPWSRPPANACPLHERKRAGRERRLRPPCSRSRLDPHRRGRRAAVRPPRFGGLALALEASGGGAICR